MVTVNDFVTKENFKINETLNETFDIIYVHNYIENHNYNDKPIDPENGDSVWRNEKIIKEIRKINNKNSNETTGYTDIIDNDVKNYLNSYLNSYAGIYTLKDANILKVILSDTNTIKYFYQKYFKWNRTGKDLNKLNTLYKNLSVINDFIDNNNLDRKIQERDHLFKGIKFVEHSEKDMNNDSIFTIKNQVYTQPIIGIVPAKKRQNLK